MATKDDLKETEMKRKTNKTRRNSLDSNIFETAKGDAEVVAMFKEMMKFIFLPANITMGVKVTYNWKPHHNFMTWFSLGNLTFAWMCLLYTQYHHTMNGDITRNLEVFATYGVASSVCYFVLLQRSEGNLTFLFTFLKCAFKSTNYIKHFKKVLALLEFMQKMCRLNSFGRRADILKNELQKCYRSLKMFTVCVLVNACLFLSVPFISYSVNKELISLAPIEILFIDQSTLSGYFTANLILSLDGILAASGTIFCATLYILLISNFTVQVELIEDDFKCLDEMWADKKRSLAYKRAFIQNICMRCQDMNK